MSNKESTGHANSDSVRSWDEFSWTTQTTAFSSLAVVSGSGPVLVLFWPEPRHNRSAFAGVIKEMNLTVMYAIMHDLPGHLAQWNAQFGPWIYLILFGIIFAETGLVVLPLLPGDSLLFALGALTVAVEGALNFWTLLILLILAAIAGDALNYSIGRVWGRRLFTNPKSRIFNPKHLRRTEEFYARHGGRTILLARFIPIIRTYAPFVAGMADMKYSAFAVWNVAGGVLWIGGFLSVGRLFGNLPQVKSNFHYVIFGIIAVSLIPVVFEYIRARHAKEIRP